MIWKKTEKFVINLGLEYKTIPGKPGEHINKIFSDKIKGYLKKLKECKDKYIVENLNVASQFEKFISFKPTNSKVGLPALFNLPKTSFLTYRSKNCKKTVISENRLTSMEQGLKKSIRKIYTENYHSVEDKKKLSILPSGKRIGSFRRYKRR